LDGAAAPLLRPFDQAQGRYFDSTNGWEHADQFDKLQHGRLKAKRDID
jgi:hypothetical protein